MKKSMLFLLILLVVSTSCAPQAQALQVITPSATVSAFVPLPSNTPTNTASPTPTLIPSPTATPGLPLYTDDALKSEVDSLAQAFLAQYHNPGVSVAVVVRNPQTRRLQAMLLNYGTIGKGVHQPITSQTVYEIGSITKVFTGILLAEKVNDGTVNLQDPIQNFMPGNIQAPEYKETPIKLVDLATHRSGLPRDLDSDDPRKLYAWLNQFQPVNPPGAQYSYSNLGYMLLGDILSRLAQTDYGSLEFASISQPLGLIDTREVLTGDENDRLAQGYAWDGTQALYFPQTGAMSGAGYLRSTLQDLTRFLLANMDPDQTPLASSIKLAQTVQAEGKTPGSGIGLGWEIDKPGTPLERLWKSGGTPGFTSYISFLANGNSGFVILTNGQKADSLASDLVNLFDQQ